MALSPHQVAGVIPASRCLITKTSKKDDNGAGIDVMRQPCIVR